MMIHAIGAAHAALRAKVKRSAPGSFTVEVRKRRGKAAADREQNSPPKGDGKKTTEVRA